MRGFTLADWTPSTLDRLHNLQNVASLSARFADRSNGKFNHGMGGETCGKAPGPDTASDLFDAVFAINVHEVDRKSHEKSMYRFARNDPQAFSRPKSVSTQQALRAFGSAASDFDAFAQRCIPGYITNQHFELNLRAVQTLTRFHPAPDERELAAGHFAAFMDP